MAENRITPPTNHAFLIRNQGAHAGSGRGYVFGQPRPKFTFFMLFEINRAARPTWYDEAVRSGLHLAAVKSCDHPSYEYDTTEMRSYNAIRLVKTKIKYKPVTAKLWDDSTAYVARLLKEYRKWYHYGGNATSAADFGDRVGPSARGGSLPSIGLKSKETRHFFDAIKIYDLGTNPGSVNVYTLVHPVITGVDHGGLDYSSTDHVEYGLTFQHEGFYEEVAQPLTRYPEVFTGLGIDPSSVGFDVSQMGMVGLPSDDTEGSQIGDFVDGLLGTDLFSSARAAIDVVNSVKSQFDAVKTSVNSVKSQFDAVRTAARDVQRAIEAKKFSIDNVINAAGDLVSTAERVPSGLFKAGKSIVNADSSAIASASARRSIKTLTIGGDPVLDQIRG